MRVLLLLILLAGSAWAELPELSPAQCRQVNVRVPEGYVIPGNPKVIVIGDANARWRTPYHADPVDVFCKDTTCGDGCARYIGRYRRVDQWGIYFRNARGMMHALCHAEYQIYSHME